MLLVFILTLAVVVAQQQQQQQQQATMEQVVGIDVVAAMNAFLSDAIAQFAQNAGASNVVSVVQQMQEADDVILCPEQRLQVMSNLLSAVQRTVVKGSKLFNNGKAALCAQLYYQTIQQGQCVCACET
jgi:hypothetical protein